MSVSTTLLLAVLLAGCVTHAPAAPVARNLKAEYRRGQVFLTWDESREWQGALTVVGSPQPITSANVGQATVVAGHINPGSAYDWWLNPESFGTPLKEDPRDGAEARDSARRLPCDGRGPQVARGLGPSRTHGGPR